MLLALAFALQASVGAPPQDTASRTADARARHGDVGHALPPFLRQRIAPVHATTPPSGDTVGYWQQRLRYVIGARLDERAGVLYATGTLVYVNNSPDTLREFYVHQYLNAFRPGSKWSASDEREGRVRFQRLRDPDYGYERFTAPARFDGVQVGAEYPGAPDSTVARFRLPRALLPNDSVRVEFEWAARPSTVPRRQARRGRSFDFAQWYPKPAVYDRGGWEPHAFVPAGELYGEFGDYDVTIRVRDDQVIGATGVAVRGDPGYPVPARERTAYDTLGAGPITDVQSGYKAVRFRANDVHHFGWSTSPDYRHEGGTFVRAMPATGSRARSSDTVSIHVLYRRGDEREWGGGQAVERTRRALAWLESRYGPYAYPQMTVLHRIEGGGTEFPMMQMNGSASQGLILHEGGHVYSYGILANNEWRSGWMDEGLTEYQTEWAQGLTRPERAARTEPLARVLGVRETLPSAPARVRGYAGLAVRPAAAEEGALEEYALVLNGRADPIELQSERFRDFGTYNEMIYSRAAMMYGALRDAVGDSTFTRFLHAYYSRWALRHVDEDAMRTSAEAASGRDLGWFFAQWVHRTGLIDYAITRGRVEKGADGYLTQVTVSRVGDYEHPMPVGVRTASGWTTVRAEARRDRQTVSIATRERPLEARLDPDRVTEDWYRPNDSWSPRAGRFQMEKPRNVVDWPLLDQASADRVLLEYRPMVWYSDPNALLLGLRLRSNYQGVVSLFDAGLVGATRTAAFQRGSPWGLPRDGSVQWWISERNPRLFGRVYMGTAYGVWNLDGVSKLRLSKAWDVSPFTFAAGAHETTEVALTSTHTYSPALVDSRRWSGRDVIEGSVRFARHAARAENATLLADAAVGSESDAGYGLGRGRGAYARAEASLSRTDASAGGRAVSFARVFGSYVSGAPRERQVYASAADPTSTFENSFWRPRGGVLAPSLDASGATGYRTVADGHYRPLGGAGLRGYDPLLVFGSGVAANVEEAVRLTTLPGAANGLALYASVFGDVGIRDLPALHDLGHSIAEHTLADAGPSLLVRGRLYDREVRVRADFPLFVRGAGVGDEGVEKGTRFRFAFSFEDLW